MACSFESIEDIPRACLLRCPSLKALEVIDEHIEDHKNIVIDVAMSEEVDELADSLSSVLGEMMEEGVSKERIASAIRQASSVKLDDIEESQVGLVERAKEISDGCTGPLEILGTDSVGRSIGVFICASPLPQDGESIEPAAVYRFPRQ